MNSFTIDDFDKVKYKYSIGVDSIGLDDKGDCAGYILRDEKNKIFAIVDAREFDNACKKFVKYYEKVK